MKKLILSLAFLFVFFLIFGQQGDGGTPKGFKYFQELGAEIPNYSFEQPDIAKLRAEDKINDSLKTGPWRFGYNYTTSMDFYNSGQWSTAANGDKVWLMKITSDQAKTINLTFSNTVIPEGNELFIYNPEKTFVLGKFTQNHIYNGQLGAELVPGNTVIVEYYVPSINSSNIGNIEVSKVTHGYRTSEEYQTRDLGSSGSCNMNVNCPDGAPFKDQRNSVILTVVNGNGHCSAALINNTAFDGKPYVLTAKHCLVNHNNPAVWIFRFNWQSPDCNDPATSPSFESVSGAALRSMRTPSDFALLEITGGLINGTIPENCNPYFSGWDNTDIAPKSTFSIHHPSRDIKKISFDDDSSVAVKAMSSTEENSSWKVVWDRNTTTESGSSGSPLFNHRKQIIGQLWGGGSNCFNSGTLADFYGRIHNSWEPTGSSNAEQLKHWLDPFNTGQTSIIGYDPYGSIAANDVTIFSIEGEKGKKCEPYFAPSIEVFNSGTIALTSLTIKYSYNGNSQSINWTGNLAAYQAEMVQLPLIYSVDGTNLITVELLNPNGQTDDNVSDNFLDLSYEALENGATIDFEFYLGCYGKEVSWKLQDLSNNILYSGKNYPESFTVNYLVSEVFCLANGCYQLILNDTGGDGVEGEAYTSCNYTGSMILTQRADNQILAALPKAEANFGFTKVFNFCIDKADLSMNELEKKVNIYPNPSKGVFNITMDFQGEKEVTLTNLTGKVVGIYRVNENHLQINESQLSTGIYMLTIANENNRVTRKLVIE